MAKQMQSFTGSIDALRLARAWLPLRSCAADFAALLPPAALGGALPAAHTHGVLTVPFYEPDRG